MLRMSKEPLNAAQVRSYHENDFVNAEQRYYSEDSTVRGEWQGKLAAAWGLSGGVREEQFYRLTEGQHPLTGEQLVRHRIAIQYKKQNGNSVTNVEHRAGWDATFNAPKSVSITGCVWQLDLAHFGGLNWPTWDVVGWEGHCFSPSA